MSDEQRWRELDGIWEAYRQATPEPEASVNFMPELWARIEAERSVGWVRPLERLATRLLPVAAALTMVMAALVWTASNSGYFSYADFLATDLLEEQRPTDLALNLEEI
jgi:hypothetical protein